MKFIKTNRVFFASLIGAIILVLQQALSNHQTDWKAIAFAVLLAGIGVIANEWKGKGLTLFGVLGTLAGTFQTIWSTGHFTMNEFILSSGIAILLAVSGSLQPENAGK
jgi:hypothetical protein